MRMAKRQRTVGKTHGTSRAPLSHTKHSLATLTRSGGSEMSLDELAFASDVEHAVRKAGGKLPNFLVPKR